jgi:hypothetical protein
MISWHVVIYYVFSLTKNVPMRLLYTQLYFCPPSQARGVPEVQLVYKSLIGSTSIGDPNLIMIQHTSQP